MMRSKRENKLFFMALVLLMSASLTYGAKLENVRLLEAEDTQGNSYQPLWSADGKKIAFEKNSSDSEDKDIYIADLTKEPVTFKAINPLKTETDFFISKTKSKRVVFDLCWSPSGSSKYVYTGSTTQENMDLFISEVGRVTNDPKADGQPAWSPNDKYIAFVSSRQGKGDIYVFDPYALELDAMEKGKIRLTNDPVSASLFPTWSPDGKALAYVSHFESNDDIYVLDNLVKPERRDHKRITTWESSEINPSWSPDGKRLAFYSDHGHPKEFSIFVVPADGSAPPEEIATDVVKNDRLGPAWTADGKYIIYVLNNPEAFNPMYLVETIVPYQKSLIQSNTQMNGDVNLISIDGKAKITFVAQGEKDDHEKRWLRVYIADLLY